MSRSYRHNPVLTEQQRHSKRAKSYKRLSNKWVRKHDVLSYGSYKKNKLTYNICDYKFNLYSHSNNYKLTRDEILEYFRK